jgi:hypothetical protein
MTENSTLGCHEYKYYDGYYHAQFDDFGVKYHRQTPLAFTRLSLRFLYRLCVVRSLDLLSSFFYGVIADFEQFEL